ncbi:hypothetical protein ABIA06_003063 [Bradyrhizobium yuanmingense]
MRAITIDGQPEGKPGAIAIGATAERASSSNAGLAASILSVGVERNAGLLVSLRA